MDIPVLEQAVQTDPSNLEARQQLVTAYLDDGDQESAVSELKSMIARWPDLADAYMMLGTIYQKNADLPEAGNMYSQVVKLQPSRVPAWVSLAHVFSELNNFEQAVWHCRKALEVKPDAKNALRLLAFSLIENNEKEEARQVLEKFNSLYPDITETDYLLAALSGEKHPDQSPEDYVKKTFDAYAASFEHSLVDVLKYDVPALLNDDLRRFMSADVSQYDILDLGCGTGLMGQQLADVSGHMAGVDLSELMLKQAEDKHIYDELICRDIYEMLADSGRRYDIVVSTDVFIYIGKLDHIFREIYAAMNPGGLFGFSIELAGEGCTYQLRDSGRYAQSLQYIDQLIEETGFDLLSSEKIIVRWDHDKSIEGYNFVLRKQ